MPPPPLGTISLILVQGLARILSNNRLTHPSLGLAPPSVWEILDPLLTPFIGISIKFEMTNSFNPTPTPPYPANVKNFRFEISIKIEVTNFFANPLPPHPMKNFRFAISIKLLVMANRLILYQRNSVCHQNQIWP